MSAIDQAADVLSKALAPTFYKAMYEAAKIAREADIELLNAIIVVAEDHGMTEVSLKLLRDVAEQMAKMPLPCTRAK